MLAQNFKTAAELGIQDDELEALIKVLGMLERGEIAPLPWRAKISAVTEDTSNLKFFDMRYLAKDSDCGTAGCILGWMYFVNPDLETCGSDIRSLFLPDGPARDCRSPQQAAIAVRNYLTYGEPRWTEALNA